MAPELQGDSAILERSCDVYSWAMTALQVSLETFTFPTTAFSDPHSFRQKILTDKVPFYTTKGAGRVVLEVAKGKRPQPKDYPNCPHLNDALWVLFNECWREEPSERPDINQVVDKMEQIVSWR